LALLLAPCFTVSAHSINDNERGNYEAEVNTQEEQWEEELKSVHVQRHSPNSQEEVSFQEQALEEEEISYEEEEVSAVPRKSMARRQGSDVQEEEVSAVPRQSMTRRQGSDVQEEEVNAVPRKSMTRRQGSDVQEEEVSAVPRQSMGPGKESSNRITQQKGARRLSKETSPSVQSKQSTAVGKRTPIQKNAAAKKNNTVPYKPQKSYQNSSRPRITHRNPSESQVSQRKIDTDIQSGSKSDQRAVKKHPGKVSSPNEVKNSNRASQKKSAYVQKSSKGESKQKNNRVRINRQEQRSYEGRSQYPQNPQKTNHPGKRPLSE
jgi:hypothetical protein